MKRLPLLILFISLLFGLAGCGEANPGYLVSGRIITPTGTGVEAVSIQASAGQVTQSDANGNWALSGLEGEVRLSAAKDGWLIGPEWIVRGACSSVNFFGQKVDETLPAYSVSGYVRDIDLGPMEGVTLEFSTNILSSSAFRLRAQRNAEPCSGGFSSTITNADGFWQMDGLRGPVIVTPRSSSVSFDPYCIEVVGTEENVNFNATTWFTASGTVFGPDGEPLPGVEIVFPQGLTSVFTDQNGHWVKSGLSRWVTVSPKAPGYGFDRQSASIKHGSETADFHAICYPIGGQIRDSASRPVPGVFIRYYNSSSSWTTDAYTDNNGAFWIPGVKNGDVVELCKPGWTFSPSSWRTVFSGDRIEIAGSFSDFGSVDSISCNDFYACRMQDGSIWTWGSNNLQGKLGNGTRLDAPGPIKVPGLSSIVSIMTGLGSAAALGSDGTVWTWGGNGYGELGRPTESYYDPLPGTVSGITDVQRISCGGDHTVLLRSNGTVWTCGWGELGQLGNDSLNNSSTFCMVEGLIDVTAVSAGYDFTIALKSDGTVWAFGCNDNGQMGNNSGDLHFSTPVQVIGLSDIIAISAGDFQITALKRDGTVWMWGTQGEFHSHVPVQVQGLTGITAISSGWGFTLALTADGSVWAWGVGVQGCLGNNSAVGSAVPMKISALNGVKQVSAGQFMAMALTSDGSVWVWGGNQFVPKRVVVTP